MKATDYIVDFLIGKGVTDVFGYPGGMVTHLMEAFDQRSGEITAHVNYNEQASSMAACAWAEIKGLPGVAYATSGPGATNLLTGIGCAYFDSVPCLFITGQVNTYEQKKELGVRQKGFQETDIVSMARPITKFSAMVESANALPDMLEEAWKIAMEGRRGPVLLDIPMDIQRSDIPAVPAAAAEQERLDCQQAVERILETLQAAQRPLLLLGHGVALSGQTQAVQKLVELLGIPVVTSMIGVDTLISDSPYHFGFIGAYGLRCSNFLISTCDVLLSLGSRLDCRQTGVNHALFAPDAQVIRVDVDTREMENKVSETELQIQATLQDLIPALLEKAAMLKLAPADHAAWLKSCMAAGRLLKQTEIENNGNLAAERLGTLLAENTIITADVGQNQVWIAQSMPIKKGQRVLFSGGHGAMGYALPAAIGAAVAAPGVPVICCTGDGGLQMNIQELQFIARERLPIKIVIFNNYALGMIHHFQEMYFSGNFVQTDGHKGFTVPDFCKIAQAYGINAMCCDSELLDQATSLLKDDKPFLLELKMPEANHVFPKLGMNRPVYQQEPLLSTELESEVLAILQGKSKTLPPFKAQAGS